MNKSGKTRVVAYLRTSSNTNVRENKDSRQRQHAACLNYAKVNNMRLEQRDVFYDAGVSGATSVEHRPAFGRLLSHAASANIGTILLEDASRLSRDLLAQEVAAHVLKELNLTLVSVQSPESFVSDSLMSTLIRQVMGAVNQFQRCETIERLKQARARSVKRSTATTLAGMPKLAGKKNSLEGRKGKRIRDALKPWSKKKLQKGDRSKAQLALTKAGVRTKLKKAVSVAQAKTWVFAIRKEKA